ncbi:hypothetical protein BH09BAC3_BH09BAC3_19520 [soil metagenome]
MGNADLSEGFANIHKMTNRFPVDMYIEIPARRYITVPTQSFYVV